MALNTLGVVPTTYSADRFETLLNIPELAFLCCLSRNTFSCYGDAGFSNRVDLVYAAAWSSAISL